MTPPPMPSTAELRDFPAMMLDVARLRDSDLTLMASGDEFKAAVLLWATAWHQVPAGSLPTDERLLAGFTRLDRKAWAKVRAMALRGWVEHADGRLYHPVIAEKALECWIDKLNTRISSGSGNAKRYNYVFDRGPLDADVDEAMCLLRQINPKSRVLVKASRALKPSRSRSDTSPGGSPDGMPLGSQGKGREGITLPERANDAPEDPNREAWRRGPALLVRLGRMPEPKARQLFGKILKDHELEARALLPAIVRCEATWTGDPQGYLTAAGKALASKTAAGGERLADVSSWTDEVWAQALANYRGEGAWSAETMGPEPGQPGCRAPERLVHELGLAMRGIGRTAA